MATSLVRLEVYIPTWDISPAPVQNFLSQVKLTVGQYALIQTGIQGANPTDAMLLQLNTTAANVATIVALLPQLATAMGVSQIMSYQYPVTQN